MRGMFYFDHDDGAHCDTKIIRVKRKFGYQGYGVFWLVLEVLHQNEGFVTDDILDDVMYQERIDEEWFEQFIDFCVSIDLFRRENGVLYSERMLTDIQAFKQLAEKRKAAINSRWNKRTGDGQPDNRNIKQEDNAAADDAAALAMAALNRKFDEAMQEAEQVNTFCNTDNNDLNIQTECNSITSEDDLNIQNNSSENTSVIQDEYTCNTNVKQVNAFCNTKKIKENIINKNKQQQNKTDIYSPDSDNPDDITFSDPKDSIIIDDLDNVPEFDPEQEIFDECEEPSNNNSDDLQALLCSFGISAAKATELQDTYDWNYIRSKIELLRQQDNIQNAAAWLIQAIEHDWRPPIQQSAAPQNYTAANSDNALGGKDYDTFRTEYRRVFNADFTDKKAYLQAINYAGSISRVLLCIKHAEGIGAEAFRKFVADNSIKSFAELITRRDLRDKLAELYAAATAQDTREVLAQFQAKCDEAAKRTNGS